MAPKTISLQNNMEHPNFNPVLPDSPQQSPSPQDFEIWRGFKGAELGSMVLPSERNEVVKIGVMVITIVLELSTSSWRTLRIPQDYPSIHRSSMFLTQKLSLD